MIDQADNDLCRFVIYTTSALADLEIILDWSTLKHPEKTPAYLESLLEHVDQLSVFPYTGMLANKRVRTRILHHSPFRIYYRIRPKLRRIDILHVWHGWRRGPYS